MPYIDRDESGNVQALFNSPQRVGHECLSDDHADVLVYRNKPRPPTPLIATIDAAVADSAVAVTLKDLLKAWKALIERN